MFWIEPMPSDSEELHKGDVGVICCSQTASQQRVMSEMMNAPTPPPWEVIDQRTVTKVVGIVRANEMGRASKVKGKSARWRAETRAIRGNIKRAIGTVSLFSHQRTELQALGMVGAGGDMMLDSGAVQQLAAKATIDGQAEVVVDDRSPPQILQRGVNVLRGDDADRDWDAETFRAGDDAQSGDTPVIPLPESLDPVDGTVTIEISTIELAEALAYTPPAGTAPAGKTLEQLTDNELMDVIAYIQERELGRDPDEFTAHFVKCVDIVAESRNLGANDE
jgi:hypothetical protein